MTTGQDRDWLEWTQSLPSDPGVYLMKDRSGVVIYVGKAKNLKHRVRSYFQDGSSDYRAFIHILGDVLGDIETLITKSEKEALILERELIRRHEPRFNVIWRDDKQYLCLRVDPRHEFPRVEVVRNMGRDGARYFGPFHSATAARKTLRVVNRHFQLRTCRDTVLYNRDRPCLEYQIGRCPAPCVFDIDRGAYAENVRDVLMFLEGNGRDLIATLEARMWQASEAQSYEVAARIRDQIAAIRKTLEPQHAALTTMRDQDVIGLHWDSAAAGIAVVEVRDGRIRNVGTFTFEDVPFDEEDLLESFVLQFYANREDMPSELLVPIELGGGEALSELLSERRGRKVLVKQPRRGERKRLVDLAMQNAEHALLEARRKRGGADQALERLQRQLHLVRRPERIECFDISNLQGQLVVGSQVCFVRGEPFKSAYRRYKVKSVEGQDDFRSMYEVLYRRVQRGLKEQDLPDLLVIDGGKGQLNVVRAVLDDLKARELVEVVSLAKSRVVGRGAEDDVARSPERVFVLGAKDPIVLRQGSAELRVLTRIRDEAHRFAITFHRQLRRRAHLRSGLEDIPGVGAVRRKALLRQLGSLKRVKEATVEELAAVPGVGPAAARRIFEHFHGPPPQTEPRAGKAEG